MVGNYLWIIALIAVRFYAALSVCPLFEDGKTPKMLRILLAFSFAVILFPYFKNLPIDSNNIIVKITYVVENLLVGFVVGFLFSIPIWLVENVGNLIDIQRGEQFGALINPLTKNPSSSIAKLISQGFIVYLVAANGIIFLIKIIFISFKTLPINLSFYATNSNFLINKIIVTEFVYTYTHYFTLMVLLALPIILIMFLCDLVLSLFSIFSPQLNITVISMPIKSAIGIVMLLIYLGLIYHISITQITEKTFDFLKF